MKLIHATAFALLGMPMLALAAPSSTPLSRRDGVTCTKKYEGDLYIANETTDQKGTQIGLTKDDQGRTVLTDDQSIVTSNTPVRFQFDECTTDGWNAPPQEFGQVKPVPLADQVQCVTADKAVGEADGHQLIVSPCGDYNGGALEQQWFYADYHTLEHGEQVVTVKLRGNPNSDDDTYNLGAVYVDNNLFAVQYKGAHIATLSLRNVEIVS